LLALDLVITLGILDLTRRFLRSGHQELDFSIGARRIPFSALAGVGALAGVASLFIPGTLAVVGDAGEAILRFGGVSLIAPSVQILISIYVLYLLEHTYRLAQEYQRRIARLGFFGIGSLAVFMVVCFSHVLLYHDLPSHFAEASSVVYGVVYPVVLLGFFRYRLGSERIAVPRDSVYSSATVLLTGAAFFGVACTVLAFKWLKIDFNYFELFLVVFTLCFLTILGMGSGTMRRQISRFIDQRFYSRKYDYQNQFFRLHRSMLAGAEVEGALTELVENMKYSLTVGDAFFFKRNWQDGNFYQHENKEEATLRGLVIHGDSTLIQYLARNKAPVDLLHDKEDFHEIREAVLAEPLVAQLRFDALFPVFIGELLAGILALQGGRKRPFDNEDLSLVEVFTNSIGDVLFKNQVLKERIEKKQFESFHHVASFIIHDIKNQVATLNLVVKNAERNLNNPSFQTSMMTSLRSCAGNLQSLIDRLSVPTRRSGVERSSVPLRPLLEEVAENSGVYNVPSVQFSLEGEDGPPILIDRQELFFVIRNLIKNALEAMGENGRLTLRHGYLEAGAPPRLRELFGGGERFFTSFSAFVLVEDTGGGMTPEFMKNRLFQPFATTKEKGVGIGLYQCKTIVEKMGGRILCHSQKGEGTEFCILI
jgi:putative PEP-CTERM system histidine kinase